MPFRTNSDIAAGRSANDPKGEFMKAACMLDHRIEFGNLHVLHHGERLLQWSNAEPSGWL
jgi:hypothetical protein